MKFRDILGDWLLRILGFLGTRNVVNSFYMQVNLGGSPTNPGQATTFQIVTPWGQTVATPVWEDAVNEAFFRYGRQTGRMGNYFNLNTNNGLSTTCSGSMSANDINSTP